MKTINDPQLLVRIAENPENHFSEGTKRYLLELARRKIRTPKTDDVYGERMSEQKLRVTEVKPADPNYIHNPTSPEIPENPEFKGLRVKSHGKHELVHDHPARRHPQSSELARLGTPRKA